MTTDAVLKLLAGLQRRLATVADQGEEARAQLQHIVDRVNRLRHDLARIEGEIRATTCPAEDTGEYDTASLLPTA